VFEQVRAKWVVVWRPPDLVRGLPLIVTLNILWINPWDFDARLAILPPLNHVAHALVQEIAVVVSGGMALNLRRDAVEALLQQSAKVILLHPNHVPALGTTLEVTFDHGP